MMRRLRALLGLAALFAAGCDKDKDVDPPAELVDVQRDDQGRATLVDALGDAGEHLHLSLGIAVDGRYAVRRGAQGRRARDRGCERPHPLARRHEARALGRTGRRATGSSSLGTSDGDVVALEAADGASAGRSRVSGEVLSAPLVAGDRVVVRTLDGRHARALGFDDGRELWLVEELVPRLSLRGAAAPVVSGDVVICGFDTGKLVAVSLATGETLWQSQVSTPSGRTELERLADLDAAVQVSGNDIYAVGYQGASAMLGLDPGQVWWGRDVSSYRALALDDDQIYVSDSNGVGARAAAPRRQRGLAAGRSRTARTRHAGGGRARSRSAISRAICTSSIATPAVRRARAPGRWRRSRAPLAGDGRLFALDDGRQARRLPARGQVGRLTCSPVIALVGRPNVGKSTLFNALTRTRDALVADVPGLTRDRKYGYLRVGDRPAVVIDTGGLVEDAAAIERLMAEQTRIAIDEADRVLLVVDGRSRSDAGRSSTSRRSCAAPASPCCWSSTSAKGSTGRRRGGFPAPRLRRAGRRFGGARGRTRWRS